MKKLLVGGVLSCLCGAAFAVNGSHEGYVDGMVFDLKLAGPVTPGDALTYGNICNGMRWSASDTGKATAMTSYNGGESAFGVPAPIAVSNQTFALPAYHWTNQTDAALAFPAPVSVTNRTDGTAVTNYFAGGVTMPAVVLGSNVTFHVRFRWDGNLRDAYEQVVIDHARSSNSGFGFRMYHDTEALTKDRPSTNFRLYVGGGNHNFYTTITKGRWYDFVCVMKYRDDLAGFDPLTQVTCYLCNSETADGSSTHSPRVTSFSATDTEKNYVGRFPFTALDSKGQPTGKILLGHVTESYHAAHGWQASNSTVGQGFRGAISKLRIFNRALSVNEVWALTKEADGAQVSAGSENGSADEFGAGEAADIAEVYEPMTMPISRMRGALDAAHPSLTFKYPIHPEEVGAVKGDYRVLRVVPILEGTGASVPVEATVNGVKVGTFDFARPSGCEIGLRKNVMTRDADGNVTVTLKRVGDLTGTLKIDAFKISGAWAVGAADGTYVYDWNYRDYAKLRRQPTKLLAQRISDAGRAVEHRVFAEHDERHEERGEGDDPLLSGREALLRHSAVRRSATVPLRALRSGGELQLHDGRPLPERRPQGAERDADEERRYDRNGHRAGRAQPGAQHDRHLELDLQPWRWPSAVRDADGRLPPVPRDAAAARHGDYSQVVPNMVK